MDGLIHTHGKAVRGDVKSLWIKKDFENSRIVNNWKGARRDTVNGDNEQRYREEKAEENADPL